MNYRKRTDPFWSKNSKLTIKDIEEKFPEKIAITLKLEKSEREK